jgi:hypothetical protein
MAQLITKEQSNFIKLLALTSMLVDHIGAFLFPHLLFLRMIGRIALPLFSYQITVGSVATSNKLEYIKRLLIFGAVAQVPYYFLAQELKLNILFTLALGVSLIWSLESKKRFLTLLLIPGFFFVDYGFYGLALISVFYLVQNKILQFFLFLSATLIYSFYTGQTIQILAVFSLIFIFKPFLGINLPRNFFYFFYPAHLVLILIIKTLS